MTIYDVTVLISEDLAVYPGDPKIKIEPVSIIGKDDSNLNLARYSFGSHTGTHVDPPFHFIRDGVTVDRLPLESLIGPARVVQVDGSVIDERVVRQLDLSDVDRLLFKTANSSLWDQKNFVEDFVYITPEAAELIAAEGIKLVGIDYLSVEKFDFDEPLTHLTLLGAGVVIVEGLDFREVKAGDYEMICLPLKVKDGDGAPARVVLLG
jgi:arylformamidase